MTVFPKISILIPARNEEDNLSRTFASLDALSYPKESLQVIFGNDNSEDKTGELIDVYAKDRFWVTVLHLSEPKAYSELVGKTRVLAELADIAQGDYLFFTDADISLPVHWIQGMLSEFKDAGVVVGVTGFSGSSVFSTMQGIEWLMALSLFKIGADFGFSSTGLGNNMAVSREAYEAIGGYRTIGFSIVEDFYLYDSIIKAGYGFRHAFKPEVVAYTVPPKGYFEQRKRWIKGALESKPSGMAAGIIQAFCIPILILLGFIHSTLAWGLLGILMVSYLGLILFFEHRLGLKGYVKWLPVFTFYISTAWFLQFMYFIFKKDTVWKGRKY
jgi:cellulose synthase/poly-beta-1,6-N-acetylglucosamine synthase-like glycosyltransferase